MIWISFKEITHASLTYNRYVKKIQEVIKKVTIQSPLDQFIQTAAAVREPLLSQ